MKWLKDNEDNALNDEHELQLDSPSESCTENKINGKGDTTTSNNEDDWVVQHFREKKKRERQDRLQKQTELRKKERAKLATIRPVSYTHLTLPTICSV